MARRHAQDQADPRRSSTRSSPSSGCARPDGPSSGWSPTPSELRQLGLRWLGRPAHPGARAGRAPDRPLPRDLRLRARLHIRGRPGDRHLHGPGPSAGRRVPRALLGLIRPARAVAGGGMRLRVTRAGRRRLRLPIDYLTRWRSTCARQSVMRVTSPRRRSTDTDELSAVGLDRAAYLLGRALGHQRPLHPCSSAGRARRPPRAPPPAVAPGGRFRRGEPAPRGSEGGGPRRRGSSAARGAPEARRRLDGAATDGRRERCRWARARLCRPRAVEVALTLADFAGLSIAISGTGGELRLTTFAAIRPGDDAEDHAGSAAIAKKPQK